VNPIKRATSLTNIEDVEEIDALKAEVEQLKHKHAEELTHFQNKMKSMKKERVIERQKSRMSMGILVKTTKARLRTRIC